MAEYSNSVPEWDGSEVNAGDQVGWDMQIWEAQTTTSSEPSLDNSDWELLSVGNFAGFTLIETHEQGNTPLDETVFGGFTLVETHEDRVKKIEFHSLTLRETVEQPDYPSLLTPNYVTNIRMYKSNLKGKQLRIENKLTNN